MYIAFFTSCINHIGVEVAPQTPTVLASKNQEAFKSSNSETKYDLGFSLFHALKSILPFELFVPLTNIITSFSFEKDLNCGSLPETCRHNVS